jgi:hypothetical protein
LTPSPILKVLSTLKKHRVKALLMGGQACILYGAAEFSRDVDLALVASETNLDRLRSALGDLQAEQAYVPELSALVLERGHACHFRASIPEADGLRIDVMSKLHGCDPFEQLWKRRRRLTVSGIGTINVISLPDLVQAKKTQRDKDWPMIRRLIESDYLRAPRRPSRNQKDFWLDEARTPKLLLELCSRFPNAARQAAERRAAVRAALKNDELGIEAALRAEQEALAAMDRAYWQPLLAELGEWRRRMASLKKNRPGK